MASYKVPQDVEADDKLIGPFSFRQFVYLIIVAISGGLAWGLAQIFIGLALIPLPVILFFGALALPLKKDQPMEVYLAAVVSFHLKPKKRLWQPDGIQELVDIVAPRITEVRRTKDLSGNEAEQRLSYLAQIADTRGWAVRGVGVPAQGTAMSDDVYYEAQQVSDVLDDNSGVGQNIDSRLAQGEAERRDEVVARMHQPAQAESPTSQPLDTDASASALGGGANSGVHPQNYSGGASPSSVISTSENTVSPDIISLANNPDLSVETIAHEAQRIQKKEAELDDEVVISLR